MITGASRGIGRELALAIGPLCDSLCLIARSEESLNEVARAVEKQGTDCHVLTADLRGFNAGKAAAKKALQRLGGIDTLILNAGISANKLFAQETHQEIQAEFAVNYFAPLGMTQALLPNLLRSGQPRLTVVSSLTVSVPFPHNANYSASKAALTAWLRSIAIEYAGRGLKVCIVLPGLTDTALAAHRPQWMPAMSPGRVAFETVQAMQSNRSWLIPGVTNRLGYRLDRMAPNLSSWLVAQFGKGWIPGWSA